MNKQEKLKKISTILEDKKAINVEAVNIEKLSVLSDYFVICSGTSSTHVKALSDELYVKMGEIGEKLFHREGYDTAKWILMDFDDVIVHIFQEEDRQYYSLERLWSEGKQLKDNR